MIYERKPQSRLIRGVLAAGAAAVTLALAAMIDGLAKHYPAESAQMAQKPVVVAQRELRDLQISLTSRR